MQHVSLWMIKEAGEHLLKNTLLLFWAIAGLWMGFWVAWGDYLNVWPLFSDKYWLNVGKGLELITHWKNCRVLLASFFHSFVVHNSRRLTLRLSSNIHSMASNQWWKAPHRCNKLSNVINGCNFLESRAVSCSGARPSAGADFATLGRDRTITSKKLSLQEFKCSPGAQQPSIDRAQLQAWKHCTAGRIPRVELQFRKQWQERNQTCLIRIRSLCLKGITPSIKR